MELTDPRRKRNQWNNRFADRRQAWRWRLGDVDGEQWYDGLHQQYDDGGVTTIDRRNKLVKSRRYRFGGAHSICVAHRCRMDSLQAGILGGLQCEDPRIVHDFGIAFRPKHRRI